MIQLQGVNKVYDDGFQALKNLNLEFKRGEISVLIGPSGCGKTTTMRLINRLIQPSNGAVIVDGQDISAVDPVKLRRNIGYVIQNIGLFPHMTIARNVSVVPRLLRWDKRKIDERVDELLRLVGMDPDTYRNRYPSELSGGQQQRIGVIRALAADPDIILMDEPFSALDPISREQLQDELLRLQQELKKTIVFVTHDMDEAIKIADSMILMKDGEVIQKGSPESILRHPANDFVKSFIGTKRMRTDNDLEALPSVDEVMLDNPATAYPTRGLAEAVKIMERRRVDSLLIVDRSNRLLGIVSIYQVLDQYGEEGKTVADVMQRVKHVVSPGTPLPNALNMMSEHGLSNLAVVGEDDRFVGLITRGSVVRHMADVYPPVRKEEAVYEGA
ncbi:MULTISPECIES: ABC transporter ATP-binding protein [unclassified Paenibacillus]|uniref:ABC transporter ATP-binding protein n=1 Tax=unclassified Paenibacillus TaxID=185978 RepID=UPI001C103843|nr:MULTISPECIES: betaine/proline/choline family ABC transporter ATP-binding protein [unclassified Paenibacillus]MBU5443749.1 betaine/proline/choline family ABC transporter ATP-binding protein [Paenibacillus sp. MSJ-34]CAH0120749.1 Glycine betaine/carnitine/choline transport ATP-binding protein OpuCA [Paenibacillus sp. CECT 9249]